MKNWSTASAKELIEQAVQFGAPQRMLVLAACACARAALKLTRTEDRAVCEKAIETAERRTKGQTTHEECDRATAAAWAAARAAERLVAATWATARAADATYGAAEATWWAVEAAEASTTATLTSEEPRAPHDAVRTVLTAEVMRGLEYERATCELGARVLGKRPSKRREAAWDEALASGALRALLIAWSEVEASNREDKREMLNGLVARAKEAL